MLWVTEVLYSVKIFHIEFFFHSHIFYTFSSKKFFVKINQSICACNGLVFSLSYLHNNYRYKNENKYLKLSWCTSGMHNLFRIRGQKIKKDESKGQNSSWMLKHVINVKTFFFLCYIFCCWFKLHLLFYFTHISIGLFVTHPLIRVSGLRLEMVTSAF